MPNTPNNNLVPGQPFPHSARFWNPVIEASRSHRDEANPAPSSNPGLLASSRAIVVLVKNTTGSAVGRNCPLKIDGIVISPTANELSFRDSPIFVGIAPTDDSTNKLVLTIEPIDHNGIGKAIVSGAAIATIDVTDTGHQFARPASGNVTKLVSAADGLAILYVAASTGESLGVVLLGGSAASGGGTTPGSGDSCCCPDGALKLAAPDTDPEFPTANSTWTDKKIAESSGTYTVGAGPNTGTLQHISEVSETILEDETVVRFRSTLKLSQAASGTMSLTTPEFYWAGKNPLPPNDVELISTPLNFTTGYPSVLPGGSSIGATDGIWDDSGSDTLILDWLFRVVDISGLSTRSSFGFAGYVSGPSVFFWFDLIRHYYKCVEGVPDTDGSGPSGAGV